MITVLLTRHDGKSTDMTTSPASYVHQLRDWFRRARDADRTTEFWRLNIDELRRISAEMQEAGEVHEGIAAALRTAEQAEGVRANG